MRNKISEEYRKYLIKFKFERLINYYSVWGTDMSSTNEDDFLLMDDSQQICCFKSTEKLHQYLMNVPIELPDSNNFTSWIAKFSFKTPYTTYKIFRIHSKNLCITDKSKGLNLIGNLNLILDYAQKTNNTELLKIRNSRKIKLLWNKLYEMFFWNTKKQKKVEVDTKTIELYNSLIAVFKSKVLVLDN